MLIVEISKQQILLNKNAFSFLQEGTKEVFFDDCTYPIDNSQFSIDEIWKLFNDLKIVERFIILSEHSIFLF